jgi:small subunit ribosomal protein S21e
MESGRQANQERKMKGCVNDEHQLTDSYLPRKCEYSDRILTSKDRSSIQLVICEVDENGVIDHAKQHIIPISGFVRQKGNSDYALEVVLKEKGLY